MQASTKKQRSKQIAPEEEETLGESESAGSLRPPTLCPTTPPGTSEDGTEASSLASDAPVTTSCFGLRSDQRIPRKRRWNLFCFSIDREVITFFVKVSFAWVVGLWCVAFLTYLIVTEANEVHISLIFGIFTFVIGYFLGNVPKLRAT